ncbi:MAG: DUF362 domain-containing protein [Candidatus Thermoplasmatota archaeon]|nr:DUF362 domain-containing protein [Candidatus Thermoplasmatota archaeon]
MTSKVFFADLKSRSEEGNTQNKLVRLFDMAGMDGIIEKGDLVALKLHFGESGCDAHIRPSHVGRIARRVKELGGSPFATDTNTLYKGSRHNSVDHLRTAVENGFDAAVLGCPVIIADGLTGKNAVSVKVDLKRIKSARIAGDIFHADSMIVMTHFKAHMVAGFGGAIKNVAMGCATAYGKMDQHFARPNVDPDVCIGCGLCTEVCPVSALKVIQGKARIDKATCIGCGECMTVCENDAIGLDWGSEIPPFNERMVEYAFAAVKDKKGKVGYINFLMQISPDCDCVPWSDSPIVPDIGILASMDPVALDRACFDLVNAQEGIKGSHLKRNLARGEDKFKGLRPNTDGYHQIRYAAGIGLGSEDYELVPL